MHNILSTKKYDLDSRLVQHFLSEPVSDGGQWNMLVNLVNKYGLIEKKIMDYQTHQFKLLPLLAHAYGQKFVGFYMA